MIECVAAVINQFLGSSQTFLGFIGALLVLCVMGGRGGERGNFIREITDQIQKDIIKSITEWDASFPHQDIKSRIVHSPEYLRFLFIYKSIKSIIECLEITTVSNFDKKFNKTKSKKNKSQKEKIRNESREDEEIKEYKLLSEESASLILELNASWLNYNAKTSSSLLRKKQPLLKKINDAREQFLAPLYCLNFCFVIFVFDELVCADVISENLVVTFLSIFSILSYLFWFGIWRHYFRLIDANLGSAHNKLISFILSWPKSLIRRIAAHKPRKFRYYLLALFTILILILLCWILPNIFPTFIQKCQSIKWLIASSCILLPWLFIGFFKSSTRNDFGDYKYRYLIWHTTLILIYTSIVTLILVYKVPEDLLIPYNNLLWIKLMMFLFLILNGIVMPFWSQTHSFYMIKNYVTEEIKTAENEANDKAQKEIKKLNKFIDKVSNTFGKYDKDYNSIVTPQN